MQIKINSSIKYSLEEESNDEQVESKLPIEKNSSYPLVSIQDVDLKKLKTKYSKAVFQKKNIFKIKKKFFSFLAVNDIIISGILSELYS